MAKPKRTFVQRKTRRAPATGLRGMVSRIDPTGLNARGRAALAEMQRRSRVASMAVPTGGLAARIAARAAISAAAKAAPAAKAVSKSPWVNRAQAGKLPPKILRSAAVSPSRSKPKPSVRGKKR